MAQKKIVSAGPDTSTKQTPEGRPRFEASPEAKKKALTYRLIAVALWVVAIAAEAFTIFWLLKHTELNNFMVWLIVAIVVIAIFALGGSLLWKKANRFDPASERNKVKFFVQNQLGAIITIVAFLPLIILIFANKDMKGNQKLIAGIIAIVALLGVGAASIDYNPPSIEQIDEDAATVIAYTGKNEVFWVKGGSVYHLCAENPPGTTIPALARGDLDKNPVISGTVAQAVADNKTRLSMYGFSECGLTEGEPKFADLVPSTQPTSLDPSDTPS